MESDSHLWKNCFWLKFSDSLLNTSLMSVDDEGYCFSVVSGRQMLSLVFLGVGKVLIWGEALKNVVLTWFLFDFKSIVFHRLFVLLFCFCFCSFFYCILRDFNKTLQNNQNQIIIFFIEYVYWDLEVIIIDLWQYSEDNVFISLTGITSWVSPIVLVLKHINYHFLSPWEFFPPVLTCSFLLEFVWQ